MTNYDLPAALKKYRQEHELSLSQMGRLLNMSKSAYNRLEKGLRQPYHSELVFIIEKLKLPVDPTAVPSLPNPAPKWNRPRKNHLFIPVAIAFVFLSMLVEMRGFREGFGEEEIAAGNHLIPMFIFGVVFCTIYWFFLPPMLPKRKPKRMEAIYGAIGTAVLLILIFFEELVIPVLRWTDSYLDSKPAGLWIAFTFITALVVVCFWGFSKSLTFSFRNPFAKK